MFLVGGGRLAGDALAGLHRQMTLDKIGILAEHDASLFICQGTDPAVRTTVPIRQVQFKSPSCQPLQGWRSLQPSTSHSRRWARCRPAVPWAARSRRFLYYSQISLRRTQAASICSRSLLVALALALSTSGWPLKLFESSGGFQLPDGAIFSPDAALVSMKRWQSLTAEQRRGFAPLFPDQVAEPASASGASPSDEGPRGLTALRQKMDAYQRNGARLGWLLIAAERAVEVWGAEKRDGRSAFPWLTIQLDAIWTG